MDTVRRQGWWVGGVLLLAACSRVAPAPEPFRITRVSPQLDAQSPRLLLNDSITVYFSADVLPVSVTSDSVTLLDERGLSIPGSLRVGANWVTFQPTPPVTAELNDGSFRPGGAYWLMVAGSPRPDAVRAADGRRLADAAAYPVRIADRDDRPLGLPAPLRPPANDLPFVLREVLQQLPADAPRLRLQFTQPLLPASVTAGAFEITSLEGGPPFAELVPRSVRVVPPQLSSGRPEDPVGAVVEIDLGATPRTRDGLAVPLRPGETVCVQLRRGAASLRDYAGNVPLPSSAQLWSVVAGGRQALVDWPANGDTIAAEDGVLPTFEAPGGAQLRPRVRVEAGDGSLGVFRPRQDTTLRPGQPFDRGDGERVVSRGGVFAFLAIDIPRGVTVRVEATGEPVQLLACGNVRIAGSLEVVAAPTRLPTRRFHSPVQELASQVPLAVVAAGDIEIRGAVRAATPPGAELTSLLLASAAAIDLRSLQGELPFHTMLAVESEGEQAAGAIRGSRGQSLVFVTSFTYGAAPGADFSVTGTLPWRQLPADRNGGVVHLVEASGDLQVAWQSTPEDPVRKHQPDLTVGRVSRLQPALDQDTIAVAAGAFVRFALTARVRGGQEPPRLHELRLCDR